MNLKRLLTLVTALVMAMTVLAACGQIDEEPIDNPVVTSDPAVTGLPDNTFPTEPTTVSTAPPTTVSTTPPTTVTTTEPTTSATTEKTSESTKKKDKNDFTVEEMSGTMYATISLNIRSGPSTDFGKIGALSEGEAAQITGRASTGWYQISYNGKTGYVSNVYMSSEKPAAKPASTTKKQEEGVEEVDDGESSSSTPSQSSGQQQSQGGGIVGDPIAAGDWAKENGTDYMYNLLTTDRYQAAMNILAEAVQNLSPTADLSGYVSHDEAMTIAKYMAQMVGTTYCYFDQVASITGSVMNLRYYVSSQSEAQSMVSSLKKVGDKVMNTISGYSDYNKIKYIYEYIAKNSVYGHGNYYGSAYGPLVDGNGTCVGYAKAGFYLLARAGFDTVYACGIGREEEHMWVKVKYDGSWYNVDFGWADPEPSDGIDPNYVKYDYLLVSDSYMKSTRTEVYDLSAYYSMPSAKSDSNSWYSRNNAIAYSMDDVKKILKAQTQKAVDEANGAKYIYVAIQFDTLDLHIQAYDYYSGKVFNSEILKSITSAYSCDNRLSGKRDSSGVEKTRCLVFRLKRQ